MGVLNPCAQGPRHLHAGYSIALAWSAEMEGWWPGQAGVAVAVAAVVVVVVVMVVEAAAALGEGQSRRKGGVRIPFLAPILPRSACLPTYIQLYLLRVAASPALASRAEALLP